MPASDLHLEVPCFAVRLAEAPATCQVSEYSLPAGSDGDHTEVLADQRLTVSVPVVLPANSITTVADSDVEQDAEPDDVVNANISEELATILSRAATLVETQQNANQNLTNGFRPVDSTSVNGVSHELQSSSQQTSSSAVPDVPVSANRKRSVVSRGRIRNRRAALARDRRQSLPLSAAQPPPRSLTCTTADLLK